MKVKDREKIHLEVGGPEEKGVGVKEGWGELRSGGGNQAKSLED